MAYGIRIRQVCLLGKLHCASLHIRKKMKHVTFSSLYSWTWLLSNACIQLENEEFGNTKVFAKLYVCTVFSNRSWITQHPVNFSIVETKLLPFWQNKINHLEFLPFWLSQLAVLHIAKWQCTAEGFAIFFFVYVQRENKSVWMKYSKILQQPSLACRKIIYQGREAIYQEKIWPFFRRWF